MEIKKLANDLIQSLKMIIFRGTKYYCPLCQASYAKFSPAGSPSRPNARCPVCESLERHRLLWAVIDQLQNKETLKTNGRLLHIAPERCLAKNLAKNYEYVSVDMYSSEVNVKVDITALCFSDECFDSIICNHVLEHVQDDRKALSELFRVLKHGGWGSIQVPVKGEKTLEDPLVVDPLERERHFGQSDHVRQYGEDFKVRLQAAGFEVLEIKKEELFDPLELQRLSVLCEKGVMLVRKLDTRVLTALYPLQ
jgi:SAM-dependent methyltransferase